MPRVVWQTICKTAPGMTSIERLTKIGIRRLGTPSSGFRYGNADGTPISKNDRDRVNHLRLPPAWTDVRIDPRPGTALQAIGRDAAGRWQYRYHENRIAKREREKCGRVRKFAAEFPRLRAQVARDLRLPGLPREKVLAAMVRILSTRYLRPGSRAYAAENDSYGISTLRKRHAAFKNGCAELHFRGKSGKDRRVPIDDARVVAVLHRCAKLPGRPLFQWRSPEAARTAATRRQVNSYIRQIMGDGFSAKDFRTWAATLICANALARRPPEREESRASRRRAVAAAVSETARRLGNTPAVCRGSYISPRVISLFERGMTLRKTVPSVEKIGERAAPHPIEGELVRLLADRG